MILLTTHHATTTNQKHKKQTNPFWPDDGIERYRSESTQVQAMACCQRVQCHYLNLLTNPQWRIMALSHWGRVTHICVGKLTIIGSDNGLSPGRRQAIIWTNDGILLIWPLGTNSEILSEIHSFSFKKMHLKMSSGKWRPLCFGLNVLTGNPQDICPWYVFEKY